MLLFVFLGTFIVAVLYALHKLKIGKLSQTQQLADEVNKRKILEFKMRHMHQELQDSQRMAILGSYEWTVGEPFIKYTEEYRKIFGFKNPEIRLNDVCALIYMEDVDLFRESIERLMQSTAPLDIEFRIVDCDGIFKVLQAHLKMIFNEEGIPFKLCGIVQDLTKIKKTEDLLMQKAMQLECSKNDLMQFIKVASHDLNEPLRKLQTYFGLLRNECSANFGERGKVYINTIKKSACRLHNLIEDLTILSNIGLQKDHFEETDLTSILNTVVKNIEVEFGNKLKITFDQLPVLTVLSEQIVLLFYQLLQNAIKFKKEGEEAEVKISYEIVPGKNLGTLVEKMPASAFCFWASQNHRLTVKQQ